MSAIVHSDREQWLAWRREHVTASDAAAILGEDRRRGPLAIYLSKAGAAPDVDETRQMLRGRRRETPIAEEYEEETGRKLDNLGPFTVVQHPDLPWLGATLDRMHADAALGPLEAKNVAGVLGKEWKDGAAPDAYRIQLAIQIACTGSPMGVLAALVGGVGDLVVREEQRHDGFLRAALPKLEEFWLRVQRKDPPLADATPGTTDAIRQAFSQTDGSIVALDEDALDVVETWEKAKGGAKEIGVIVDECANKLRMLLGDAQEGRLPDGSVLTLPLIQSKGYVVEAKEYRRLSRRFPKRSLKA